MTRLTCKMWKTRTAGLTFTAALLLAARLEAQSQAPHVCGGGPGPNEVMAGVQPGGNGAAPTPLCYWKSDQQQANRPIWETRWGAIAFDEGDTNAGLGVATDMESRRRAKRAALDQCKVNGGTDCKVGFTYHDQCAVVVAGYYSSTRGYTLFQGAATVEEASAIGMRKCRNDGADGCTVYYSGCSLPKQVQ